MKKTLLSLVVMALFLVSCGEKKKEEVKKEVKVEKEEKVVKEVVKETKQDGDLELGKKLFTEKTCFTCHQPDAKVIGPSIKDINKIYSDKGGDMLKFLKGQSAPIVDTDLGQVAIMKANLEGFVKDLKDEELNALVAYMKSVK